VRLAASVKEGSIPPLPQKLAITASILAKSAQSSNGLNKNGIPKRANDRIDQGSSERVAALALGGLEPNLAVGKWVANVGFAFSLRTQATIGVLSAGLALSFYFSHFAAVLRQIPSSASQVLAVTHGVGLIPPHCDP